MAKQTQNKLKNVLLFGFVIISILLVAYQWVDGLIGEDPDNTPGFVRPTMANFNVDDDAYQNWNQLDETLPVGSQLRLNITTNSTYVRIII